jgi:hypothetical protein
MKFTAADIGLCVSYITYSGLNFRIVYPTPARLRVSAAAIRCCPMIGGTKSSRPAISSALAAAISPPIPQGVAPQQSPPPFHRPPAIVADPGRALNALAQPHCKDNAVCRIGTRISLSFSVTASSRQACEPVHTSRTFSSNILSAADRERGRQLLLRHPGLAEAGKNSGVIQGPDLRRHGGIKICAGPHAGDA